MSKTQDPRVISAESVIQTVEKGAKSPTAIAKALGFKSGSSSIIKRLIVAVPDLRERLAAHLAKAEAKAETEAVPANPASVKIPNNCPYRRMGGYAKVYSLLFANKGGMNKRDLIKRYVAWSGKSEKNAGYDVHVVLSPREDGSSHRSASTASQSYWVERKNDWCRLHLVGANK